MASGFQACHQRNVRTTVEISEQGYVWLHFIAKQPHSSVSAYQYVSMYTNIQRTLGEGRYVCAYCKVVHDRVEFTLRVQNAQCYVQLSGDEKYSQERNHSY